MVGVENHGGLGIEGGGGGVEGGSGVGQEGFNQMTELRVQEVVPAVLVEQILQGWWRVA